MLRWMGESAGFGGQPDREEAPHRVASFGGEAFVEVDLRVGDEPDDEDDGCQAR